MKVFADAVIHNYLDQGIESGVAVTGEVLGSPVDRLLCPERLHSPVTEIS